MAKKRKTGFDYVVLNRKPRPYDHRDWMLSGFITPEMRLQALTVTSKDWSDAKVLDQGSTPHCVGYAWAGYGIAEPVVDDWDNKMGDEIYYRAKEYDNEPNQENGSTTLSGVKAFMTFADLEGNGYAWATNMDDIITWVLVKSPVVVGTNWYYDMFFPNADGLVRVGGGIAGGHEWMIVGVDTVAREFHCVNSWGTSFGINGTFKIGFDDFEILFNEQGDAVTAVETPLPVPPPPDPTPTPNPGCLPVANLFYKLYQWLK